jgi:phosphate transport system substrate-binding protein
VTTNTARAMLILATGLLGSGRAESAPLNYIGCSVVRLSFMANMISAFKTKTGLDVAAADGGDAAAIKAVNETHDKFGGVCRELYKAAGEDDLRLYLVGWGALVVVVNAKNPVRRVTIEQVKQVFDGKITNWKELGGRDQEIHPVARKPGKFSGVGYSSKLLIFRDLDHVYGAKVKVAEATAAVEDEVANDEAAIGFSDVMSAKKNPKLVALPLENVVPDKANVATGRYSLFRPLFLVVHKDYAKQNPDIQKFVDFVLSPEGQKIVATEGMVSLAEGARLQTLYPWINPKAVVNLRLE